MANEVVFNAGAGGLGTGTTAATSKSVGSTNAGGTTATISGNVVHNTTAAANLFSQNAGATLLVSGTIQSGGDDRKLSINDTYSYALGLNAGPHELVTRDPVGTVTFTGDNSYTSDTRVVAGTLLANNSSGSATGGSNVTVESGATLGGDGAISAGAGKMVIVNGTLQVGYDGLTSGVDLGVATMGGGSTTLGAASMTLLDLWSTTGADQTGNLAAADLIDFGGDVNIMGGATLTLGNPNALTFQEGDVFKVFDWTDATPTGMWTLDESALDLASAGLLLNVSDLYTGGTVSVGAIPEPGRAALLLLGGMLGLMRRRR
jgi:autotransporter-associated beta strand protein